MMVFRVFSRYKVIQIEGKSMDPIYHDGWYLLFKRINPDDLKRSKIILFRYQDKWLIKRVVGLPNEFIQIKNGDLFIDDILYEEKYLNSPRNSTSMTNWQLSSSEFIVLGDNSVDSLDSRSFGVINSDQIQFQLVKKIWPIC